MKVCKTCGETKETSEFYRQPGRSLDGLMGSCKACKKAYQRKYREENAESSRAAVRAWLEQNKDRHQEAGRRWRANNPERLREHARRWRGTRRARERNAFVEVVDPLVVLERDDGACGICGDDVDPLDFHVDHVEPLARGGEHSYANTQVAHPACNLRKHTKLMEQINGA